MTTLEADPMKMSEDERQCLSESRGGSANVISIFSYCARRYWCTFQFFGGVSGLDDRGGGDNSIQFINFGSAGDKSFKE